MRKLIKSVGHGLFAAGVLLSVIYFWGAYLKGGDALGDALNPFGLWNYLALAPLAPGALMLWLADRIDARNRRYENK